MIVYIFRILHFDDIIVVFQAFESGILWIGNSNATLFVQARFQGVQVYNMTSKISKNSEILEFEKTADFYIPHEGFCKG